MTTHFWRFRIILLGLVFGLITLVACGSPKVAGVEAGNSTIAGVVLDSLQNPMVGVEVSLFGAKTTVSMLLEKIGADQVLALDTTNSKGEYRFTSLVAGEYRVRAAISADSVQETTVTVGTESRDIWVAQPSMVAAGTSSSGLVLSSSQSSSLAGVSSSACTPAGLCASFVDSADGATYKTVKVGGQIWMAENLRRVAVAGNSWCYNDDEANCVALGRMYDWAGAMASCPAGFHLPDSTEWSTLTSYAVANVPATAGVLALKAVIPENLFWVSAGDPFGFAIKPGGHRVEVLNTDGLWYQNGGVGAWFWSSDPRVSVTSTGGEDVAVTPYFTYDGIAVQMNTRGKDAGLSVRCLQ